MRILQLRLKNLNSLVGAWEIDFEDPSFLSDGLFAITGPTGAGKSTILDAICLALYGRTPRLERVNKSSNEVMSRQTAECYVEVVFQNQKGKYLCHWAQQRSRKKVHGNLQNPKHEIVEADSGKVLETQLRKVSEKVEEVTGMDFHRFTRSMLLAQGGFAAFLQASPDERAPILEQITGTEIYSLISLEVHKKKSEEKIKLDYIQKEFTLLQPLEAEDEQKFATIYKEKKEKVAILIKEIEKKTIAFNSLETIEKLDKEIAFLVIQQTQLQERLDAFLKESEKLRKAKQALEFSAPYALVVSLRKGHKENEEDLKKIKALVPKIEDKIQCLREKEQDLEKKYAQDKINLKKGQKVIQKVREMDFLYAQKVREEKELFHQDASLQASLCQLQKQRKKINSNGNQASFELHVLEKFFKQNSVCESLVRDFSRIKACFEQLKESTLKLEKIQCLINQQRLKLKESQRVCLQSKQEEESLRKNFQKQARDLEGFEKDMRSKLKGKSKGEWQRELLYLNQSKIKLEQVTLKLGRMCEIKALIDALLLRKKQLLVEEKELLHLEKEKTRELDFQEKELQHLEVQLSLLHRIKDLEKMRHTLEDAKPCPLCGSLDHPFAKGNIPSMGEKERQVIEKKDAIKKIHNTLLKILSEKAKNQKEKECVSASHGEKVQELDVLKKELKLDALERGLKELSKQMPFEKKDLVKQGRALELLQDSLQEIQARIHALELFLEEIEKLEEHLEEKKRSSEKAHRDVLNMEKKERELAYKKENAEKDFKSLEKEKSSFQKQVKSYQGTIKHLLDHYRVEFVSFDNPLDVLQQVHAKCEKWEESQKAKVEWEKALLKSKSLEKQLMEQINHLEGQGREKQEALKKMRGEKELLLKHRKELFQEKNPDKELEKLSNLAEQSELLLKQVRDSSNVHKQDMLQQKAHLENLEKEVNKGLNTLIKKEQVFAYQIDQSCFKDEKDFKSAILSEHKRRSLEEKESLLLREKMEVESALRDRREKRLKEKEGQDSAQRIEELGSELKGLKNTLNGLQQEVGRAEQKLKEHEMLCLKRKECVKNKQAQQKEYQRWDILHTLIGSSDGKKYRNFAQGLTFEMMIAHANLQLQKMTDRYLLTRDPMQALELNVVDNYQAGEERTTKNLSGGESFIISLSLALGLSAMASRNVRIDSLFLDEGFGALDEDVLDSALDTLAHLHQEGKIIGVISHVPMLKERIAGQINVFPKEGGKSSISGAACRAL